MPGVILPSSDILVRHGSHAVALRPSLRAAMLLAESFDDFGKLFEGLARESLTAIKTVIRASTTDQLAAERLLESVSTAPLGGFVPEAQAACLAVLTALLAQPESTDEKTTTTKTPAKLTAREYHSELFRYATGWLGWTPSETWNASPGEISAAFAAHVDRMVKLTPGAESTDQSDAYTPERLQEIDQLGYDPAFERDKLRALRARQ